MKEDLEIAVYDLSGHGSPVFPSAVLSGHSLMAVTSGELHIRLKGHFWRLGPGDIADVLGDDGAATVTSVSDDIGGHLMMFSDQFITEVFRNNPPFPVSYLLRLRKNPVIRPDGDVFRKISEGLEEIRSTLSSENGMFCREIAKCRVNILMMILADTFIRKGGEGRVTNDRKSMIFKRFMLMIPEYVRQDRKVASYAGRLCITPQYLRRIAKMFSRRTASDLISGALVIEICKMLQDTDKTVMEIADELNFSDQAVLSKFFKRHTGLSPLSFRASHPHH
ncbi:MAG: helix-turn-helix domain-containing protein [Candidatus Cryptobacteroides sp.]